MRGSIKMARLDILTMKLQYTVYLTIVLMVPVFKLLGDSLVSSCVIGAWVTAPMTAIIFGIQEKNGLERLYGSVPLRLRDVVRGRYLFVLLIYTFSFSAEILLCYVFSMLLEEQIALTDAALGLGSSFLVFATITGIQLPLYFRLGFTKGQLWSMVALVAVLALVVVPTAIESLADLLQTALLHPGAVTVVYLLLGCGVMLASCRISEAASRRRR